MSSSKKMVTILLICVIGIAVLFAGCKGEETQETIDVVMADASWDSIIVHNRIVEFILEEGYGNYDVDAIPGDTIPVFNGLKSGDIDVMMESWHENYQEVYDEAVDDGSVVNVGANMPEAPQGWYVPRYMIEGDPERDIEPMAPDLESIEDLPKYWELVEDPENPGKGRIFVGPPGWAATERSQSLMEEYGLYETYTAFLPGSGTALAASMVSSFRRGDPWVGYYWEPTAVIGRLDMVMIPGTEWPPTSVDILLNAETAENNPELAQFLEKYSTSLDQNNRVLAMMEDEDLDHGEAAQWFLGNFEETWTAWVSDDVAERVKTALDN